MSTEGEELRDEGMRRAERGADPMWLLEADTAVRVAADRGEEFTTDQVWAVLDGWGVPRPREPRAMGPVMTKAVRERVIKRTGGYDRSKRPEAHANPKPQYEAVR